MFNGLSIANVIATKKSLIIRTEDGKVHNVKTEISVNKLTLGDIETLELKDKEQVLKVEQGIVYLSDGKVVRRHYLEPLIQTSTRKVSDI